jgi:glutathione-regulated potassium-efflux system ancillary protein KefG
MKKILILFAHPRLEKSRTNSALIKNISSSGVTFHDLYEAYPDFNIDIEKEQSLLLQHDIIIWQHPLYWYSSPPLLKQWIDMVLTFGWAYGPDGTNLKDKIIFNAITSGGTREAYTKEGHHGHTLKEFLLPFYQTAKLCKMIYIPPFAIQGTHRITTEELNNQVNQFYVLLQKLASNNIEIEKLLSLNTLNEICTASSSLP